MQRSPTAPRTALALLLATSLTVGHAAMAQDTPDAQRDLYDRGLAALEAGDHDRAIALLERALASGDLNVIRLSLGRAYQRAGRCDDAHATFEATLRARPVTAPPPEEIARRVARFEAELRATCDGFIEITCTPADLQLHIDGHGPFACDRPIPLPPGTHEVAATGLGGRSSLRATIEGLTTTRVAIAIADRGDASNASRWLEGLLYLSGGAAAISTGVVLDILPDSARNFELDALDLAPVGLYAIGVSALALGLYTLLK